MEMSRKCSILRVSGWGGVEMAAARFAGDDHWQALMSIGVGRLSDYKIAIDTEEAAQSAAYLGLQMYVQVIEKVTIPPLETLKPYLL
jgi:hypothetical protein